MFKIGITGSFGSGKSTVAAMFARRGAEVIDADRIAHALLDGDRAVIRRIGRMFGPAVITPHGVDRAALGKIVFSNRDALVCLEAMVHPAIEREMRRRVRVSTARIVIIDAAILIESGWDKFVDGIIVVRTLLTEQVPRVIRRTGLERADVLRRLRQQMPLKKKLKYADFVVENSGRKSDTDKQVHLIWKKINQPSFRRRT
jgi:dephospho-CoA kinase